MIGLKFQKPLQDDFILGEFFNKVSNNAPNTLGIYAGCAQWCNENKAMIVDQGDYYEVVPIPEPSKEEVASQVRSKRDHLLSETDYLLAPDYPISPEDLDLVKAYRQALRDVPQQEGFPEKVTFPELPKVLRKDSTGLSLATVGI